VKFLFSYLGILVHTKTLNSVKRKHASETAIWESMGVLSPLLCIGYAAAWSERNNSMFTRKLNRYF